jgi:hypothetical protein
VLSATVVLGVAARGSSSSGATGPGTVSTAARPTAAGADPVAVVARTEGESLTSWTEFGLNP